VLELALGLVLLMRMAREEPVEAFAGGLVYRAEVGELHGVGGAVLGEGAGLGGIAVR